MTKRISWIDIARGLGIIFVIYAHVLDRSSIRYLFYAFHMPLFFFVSGLVHHHKKSDSFLVFLKKNFRRIVLPYFFFALLTYGWWYVSQNNSGFHLPDFLHHMGGILYGSGAGSGLFFNTILWFLPCLFTAKVLLEILSRISDKPRFLFSSLIAFAVIGYLFSIHYQKVKLPFHIETALTAVVFIGLGYLFSMHREKLFPVFEKYKWQILAASLGILFISAVWNFRLTGLQDDMRLNRLNNIFLFYISSLSGISATITFSMLLNKNRVLEYFGRISLFLFVFHPLVFFYLNKLSVFLFGRDFFSHWKNIAFAPLYTIIALGIISLGTVFYTTYVPAKISGIKSKPSHKP